ncbi:MAG: PhnD/SsuA/transferrin family substrate-binding protein [Desulfobacterales bacterium]|nr:PhnD/SsuA/transferrin family substrate-binding protein [Desulfobacterales bacterium]
MTFLTTTRCRRLVAWLLCGLSCTIFAGIAAAVQETAAAFRIGFSSTMFTDVNENDARAAIKVWGDMIVKEKNLPVATTPRFFDNLEALEESLRQKNTDVVAVTVSEYEQLLRHADFAPLFITYHSGVPDESYLLLVHRDGPIKTLNDLRGRNLNLYNDPRADLALAWLDVHLIQQGHAATSSFFGKKTAHNKLNNVILPVFFRQVDACLVTRSGLEIMGELNPQVGRQLVVLGESEAMIPAVFAFRADFSSPHRSDILAGVAELDKSPAGSQVLTIFNSQRIVEKPASALESALKLIERHREVTQ